MLRGLINKSSSNILTQQFHAIKFMIKLQHATKYDAGIQNSLTVDYNFFKNQGSSRPRAGIHVRKLFGT